MQKTISINNKYQRAAKTVPRRPKSTQKQPKTSSRRSKSPARPTKEGPRPRRAAQDGPNMAPRVVQDPSKTVQDPPGALLERSWRPSWRQANRKVENHMKKVKFPHDFGSILEPQTAPKTSPKRRQNESKIKTTNASIFYRSWSRLGPVLRRSWARLGVNFCNFLLENVMFRENRRFRKKTGSRHIFDSTWPDLGAQQGVKRSPRRAQDGSKTSPKLSPKSKRKNDRKMDRPRLHARVWRWTFGAPRPAGGGRGGSIESTKYPYRRSSTPMGRWPGEFFIVFLCFLLSFPWLPW